MNNNIRKIIKFRNRILIMLILIVISWLILVTLSMIPNLITKKIVGVFISLMVIVMLIFIYLISLIRKKYLDFQSNEVRKYIPDIQNILKSSVEYSKDGEISLSKAINDPSIKPMYAFKSRSSHTIKGESSGVKYVASNLNILENKRGTSSCFNGYYIMFKCINNNIINKDLKIHIRSYNYFKYTGDQPLVGDIQGYKEKVKVVDLQDNKLENKYIITSNFPDEARKYLMDTNIIESLRRVNNEELYDYAIFINGQEPELIGLAINELNIFKFGYKKSELNEFYIKNKICDDVEKLKKYINIFTSFYI